MNGINFKATINTGPGDQALEALYTKYESRFGKKGFNLNLKTGNLPLGRITGDFDKFSGSLDAATARVLAFTATTTVVYGLATAFNRLFTDSIKLEKQLAGIQAILQTSNSNLQKFSSELFKVANATGQSFDVAAAAASEFARQGLSVEETLKATNAALAFSKIAGTDAAQTVENLTAALNTFANEALTYTDVLDTIVSLDNAFAISAAGISDGLKRVGSVASESGIQLKEIASLIAVVQQVSARGAPVISNGLKTIFTRLSRTNVQETLNSIGVTTQDSNGEFRSQIEVLTDLANKLDTLSDRQRAFVLEQVAGVYQINTLQATLKSLSGEYSLFDKAVKVASDSSGNAAERLKILTDTTDANLQKLKNNLTQFLAETGKATVKPVLDSFIGIGNKILETLNLGAAAEGGEKAGFSIGKVLLNGISSALAGPGSVLLVVTITRLLAKITKDAFTAVQTLAGLKKASLVDEKVQMSVNKAIETGNKALVARLATTNSLVEKTRILRILMADMDRKQARAQVREAVNTGLAANNRKGGTGGKGKAAGYIPNFSKGFIPNFSKGAIPKPLEELEKKTARLKTYEPGKVVPAPNGGVMSTAETATKVEFKGKKDFIISPPQYSIAGRDHAKDFKKQYGVNIYDFIGKKNVAAKGFIPNFLDPEYIEQRKAERIPKAQRTPEQQAIRDRNAAEVNRGRRELVDIGDFAGGKVDNDKANEQFRLALKNRNVEWDDKITNVGFEVIEIDVGEDRPQKTLPDGSKKNASTNFKNSIVKKPKGDITNLTNKFEAFAIRQLNKRKDRDFNFQKARLTAFGGGNSATDGYSINPAKNSIDLLEVKSGDWKPSDISNKIGRFVPENIVTLGKPIESLFKESNRAPYSFDTIKLRNILAVPKITKQKFSGSPKKELIDKKWTSILNYKGEKPSVIAKNLKLKPVTKQEIQRYLSGNANANGPSFGFKRGGMKRFAEGFIPNFVSLRPPIDPRQSLRAPIPSSTYSGQQAVPPPQRSRIILPPKLNRTNNTETRTQENRNSRGKKEIAIDIFKGFIKAGAMAYARDGMLGDAMTGGPETDIIANLIKGNAKWAAAWMGAKGVNKFVADAAKNGIKIAASLQKKLLGRNTTSAAGFIPNFSSPFSPSEPSYAEQMKAQKIAVNAEMSSGFKREDVKIGRGASLKTPLNPQGLGVFNKPEGTLSKGMSYAKMSKIDPTTKRTYGDDSGKGSVISAFGFIPNFANAKQRRTKKRAQKKASLTNPQNAPAVPAPNPGLGPPNPPSPTVAPSGPIVPTPGPTVPTSGSAKPKNKGLGTKRMDPSRGLGLATAAAFAIPTLTGMISTPAEGEEQTKGQKMAQGAGEALGAGIMAASVALMIPAFAPFALALGLGVTAFKGLKSASDAAIPSLSNLKKGNDKLIQSAESQTNSLTEAVKAQEELSQLKESGGDARKIANAQLKFAKSLSGIKDSNLVSTLMNEKDDTKKQEAIITYQEKVNQGVKFSQANLATQTIIQQSQKENSSFLDPIMGRKTKTKDFKAEDFDLYLDPIIESLDFTKDTTGAAAKALNELGNGVMDIEKFLGQFGETLGMSAEQVKIARDTYNGLNGEFKDESITAVNKYAAASANYIKNLKKSIVVEKPTFNVDIQGVFDKALKSLTLDTALINYKNFASAGTDLKIGQNRLDSESQSGRLTETDATNRSADLQIKELKLETDKKGTQLISDAVDDLIKIIPKETSTEQKANILNQANAVLRGGGDISSLENIIKQTLDSSDKSKEVLIKIADINQKTVEGIERLRIDQAEGTRSINVIAQDQLKESQKRNKEEIGRSTLAGPPEYANKLMDTGAVLETDVKIQKLRSQAKRSGGAKTEKGRKLLLEASDLEMKNDRIKSKDEQAQAERYGKENVVKRTNAERSGMAQIQKNMAEDIGQKLKDLNATRGKSGKSSIFSSQDIKKITEGIQIGGEGATESRRMLEEKLNNPNYAQDSTVQSFVREIKSVGGPNSIFANNNKMPATSGTNVPIAASAGVAGAGLPTVPNAAGAGEPTVPNVATGGSGVPMIPSVATGGSGVPMIPSVATGGSGAQMALGSAQLPSGQSFTSGSMPLNQAAETIQKIVDIEKNNKDYKDFEAEKERNRKLKQQRDVLAATPKAVLNSNTKAAQSVSEILPTRKVVAKGSVVTLGIDDEELNNFKKKLQTEQPTETDFENIKGSVMVDKQGKARPKSDSTRRQAFVEQVQKSGYVFKEDSLSVQRKIDSTKANRQKKLAEGKTTEQEDRDLKALEEKQAALSLDPKKLEEDIKRSDEELKKRQESLKTVAADVDSMANGTSYSKGLAERLMSGPKRPAIKEKNQEEFDVANSMTAIEEAKQEKDALEKEMESNASNIKKMEALRSSESTPEQDKALVDARNKQKELMAERDAANAKIKEGETAMSKAPKATQGYLEQQKNAIIPETYFEDKQIAFYETQLGRDLKERLVNGKAAKEGSTEKVDERIAELEENLINGYITNRAEDGTVYTRRSTDADKSIQLEELQDAKKERKAIMDRNAQINAFAPDPFIEPLTMDERINTQKQIDEIAAKNPQTVAALEEAKRRKREKEVQKGKVQSTEGYDVGIARLKDELVNGRTKMGTEGYLKGVFTKTKLTEKEEKKTIDSITELEAERKKIQDNNAKITQYDQRIAQADQAFLTQSPVNYYKTAQTQMRGITPATELEDKKIKRAEESIATGKDIETELEDKKKTKAEKEKERENSEEILKKLRADRDAIKEKPPLTEKEIFEKGHQIKKKGKPKEVRYGSHYETYVREEVLREEKESQYQALKANQKLISDEETRQVRFETKYEDADIANLESRRYTPEKMAEEEKRLADARVAKQALAGKVRSTAGYDQQISSFEDLLKNGRMTVGAKGEKVMTPLTEEEKIKTQMSLEQAKEEKTNAEAQNAQIVELQGKQDKAKARLKFSDPQEYLRILKEEEAAKTGEKDSVMTAEKESVQKLKTLRTEREKIKGQLDRGFKDNNLTPEEQRRAERMKVEDEFDAKAREQEILNDKILNKTATPEEMIRASQINDGGKSLFAEPEKYGKPLDRRQDQGYLAEKEAIEAKPINERTEQEKSRLEELNTGKNKERIDAAARDQGIRSKQKAAEIKVPLTKEEKTAQQEALKLKDREIFDEEIKKKGLAAQLPQAKDEKARQEEIKSAQDRLSRLDPVKMQTAAIAKLKASKDPNLQGVGAQMESISQKELELKTLNSSVMTPEEEKKAAELKTQDEFDAKVKENEILNDKILNKTATPEEQKRYKELNAIGILDDREKYSESLDRMKDQDLLAENLAIKEAIEAKPVNERTEGDYIMEKIVNGPYMTRELEKFKEDRALRQKSAGTPEAKKKAEALKTQIEAEKQNLGVAYDQNRGAIDQTLYKDQVSPMLAEQIANPEDQLKVAEFNDKVQERQAKEAELDPVNKKIADIEAKRKERSAVASEASKALTGDGAENDKKRAIFDKFTRGELTAEEANTQSGGQLGAAFDRVSKNKMNKQAADQAKADLATSGDSMEERFRKKEVYGKFSRGEITQAEADKQTGGGLKAAFSKVVPDKNAPKFQDLNNVGNVKEEEKRKAEIEKQVAKAKEEESTLGAAIKPLLDAVTALTAAQTATKEGGAAGTTTEGGAAAPTEQGGEKKITTNSNVNVTVTGGSLTDAHVVQLQEGLQTFTIDNINKAFVNAGLPAPNLGPPAATTAVA